LRIDLELDGFCLSGSGVPRAVHVVSLRTPADDLRNRFRTGANRHGRWFGCFNSVFGAPTFINAGDVIKVRVDGRKRRFTIPDIRPRTDRVGDAIRGRGPAGTTIQISIDRVSPTTHDPGIERAATVDERGRWRVELSGDYDIVGGMRINARLAHAGMVVRAASYAPYFKVSAGGNVLSGAVDPGQTVDFRLVDGEGATRATASTRRIVGAFFHVALQDDRGNAVYPRAGDRIESDIAADGRLLIPDSYLRRSSDLAPGDGLELTCRTEGGDELMLTSDARP
jgi:hypothetical protein